MKPSLFRPGRRSSESADGVGQQAAWRPTEVEASIIDPISAPAVARPGRCAANIELDPLSEQEATAWLERPGVPAGADAPRILGSLYAQLEGRDPAEAPRLTTLGE